MKVSQRPLATDIFNDDFLYWVQPSHLALDINDNMVAGKRLPWTLLLSKAEAVIQASTIAALGPAFDSKVDKVAGKGLSTNDFTNAYKGKVDSAENFIDDTASHGLVSGGSVTLTGGVGFNVAAGIAHTHDPDDHVIRVVFGGGNFTTQFDGDNWIYVKYDGTIEQFAAEIGGNDQYAHLGYIRTALGNTVVVGFSSLPRVKLEHIINNMVDFVQYGLGTRVKSGLAVSEQANPNYLKVTMSAGSYFLNVQEVPVAQTSSFAKVFTTSDYGPIQDNTFPDTINTSHWNNPSNPALTALVEMTAGYWKKDLFFITPSGTLYYAYGSSEHATEDEALKAPYPPVPESIVDSICYLATIVSQKGDASIANRLRDVRPMRARLFGEAGYSAPTTAIDHGDLTGNNDDDHLQYFNVARGDARYALLTHNHDLTYSPLGHNHNTTYSLLGHDHSGVYSLVGHNHDLSYSPLNHNHDLSYAPITHNHDGTYSLTTHDHSGVYSPVGHSHSGEYSLVSHDHSGVYSLVSHNHDSSYSPIGHNHNGVYSLTSHDHSGVYSLVSHDHTGVYSPVAHTHSGVYQPVDADLTAIAAFTGTGYAVRTNADTWALRTFTVTANQLAVSNASGVADNTNFGLASNPIVPGTEGMTLAGGTALQRPGTPLDGQVRWNATEEIVEGYASPYGTASSPTAFQRTMVYPKRLVRTDEFISGANTNNGAIAVYGDLGWTITVSNNATFPTQPATDNHPGILRINAPNGGVGRSSRLHLGSTVTTTVITANQIEHIAFLFRLTDITTERLLLGGGTDMSSNTLGTDSIRFQFDPSVSAAMQFFCRSGGTDSTASTTLSLSANTWYLAEAFFDGTTWTPVVNGVAYTGVTTRVPTVGINVGLNMITNVNGVRSVDIDMFSMISRELGARY